MKRAELVRHLERHGCVLKREGGEHSLFWNPVTGKRSAVPRHREVNDLTARRICRDLERYPNRRPAHPKPPGKRQGALLMPYIGNPC